MRYSDPLNKSIDTRIAGTRFEYVFQEFISNSALFPLASVFLQIVIFPSLRAQIGIYVAVMLGGALLQALYLGSRAYEQRPRPVRGNLIGPAFCTAFNIGVFGLAGALWQPDVQIYWGYALLIGIMQALRLRLPLTHFAHGLLLAESIVRAGVLILLFGLFHLLYEPDVHSWGEFFSRADHVYVILLILMFGTLIGLADINAHRYLTILRQTARELRRYSEWLLGEELLQRTVRDPAVLNLRRIDRSVLFMDIRGFTAWSGHKPPEDVVELVNLFFQSAERVLLAHRALKVELTGDEIMAVFETPAEAATAAHMALQAARPGLSAQGLGLGAGVNTGPVIEGLVGGVSMKKFAVMGDTVNTGKRICEVAGAGEILLSHATYIALADQFEFGGPLHVQVKGKADPLRLHPLLGRSSAREEREGQLAPALELT